LARESKGQQVKSFKDRIPQPDQSYADEVTKVYFKVADGKFVVYLPDHIARVVTGIEGLEKGGGIYGVPRVQASTIDEAVQAWENAKDAYMRTIRMEGAVKVIRFTFFYNDGDRFRSYNDPTRLENRGHAGLGLMINHEIMWRSENRLYRGHYSGADLILDFEGHALPNLGEAYKVIEWTEEREAFFKAMETGVQRLVEQMKEFLGADVEANIAALAAGERTLAIAAPEA
jgi:hypothetical protein